MNKNEETRIHSSRMHTGRSVTVSGGLHPRRIFWGEKLEEKFELRKKFELKKI